MGVTGSNCQLCNLPLHHDHYVPTKREGMMKIYRTSSPDSHTFDEVSEKVVQFGPEHEWLTKAVAIPRFGEGGVLHGTVEDGSLTDENSGEHMFIWKGGDEDGYAYHEYCWELMGSPTKDTDAARSRESHAWALVDTYDGQLFEHLEFREHGFGWMTEDPMMSPKNRARIDAMLATTRARPVPQREYKTVRELVAAGFGWTGVIMRGDKHEAVHIVRYRGDLHPGLDTAEYPFLVWAMKDTVAVMPTGDDMQALVDYEIALVAAAEKDDAAIVLMTTIGINQTQYLIQARDEDATKKALEALPSPAKTTPIHFDNEKDPGWKNFFEKMDPGRHRR